MKIIDAIWEKRNLGVSTTEITVEQSDTMTEIIDFLTVQSDEYIVVRIPVELSTLSFSLYNLGYVYAETMHHLVRNLELEPLNGRQEELLKDIRMNVATQEELQYIYTQVKAGLFQTDRISRDPFFSEELAARRYVYWLEDEIERKSQVYAFRYQGELFGFAGLKPVDDNVFSMFLYGVFPEHQGKGLSVNMTYHLAQKVRESHGEWLSTDVSNNNQASLCSRLSGGFRIDNSRHIFVKHNKLV